VKLRPRTLRGRLALIFAVVTIAVSASVAAFVLLRYRADLSLQITENLETRYADVRGALQRAPVPFPSGTEPSVIPKSETFAQVLSLNGDVLEASPRALLDHAVLGPRQLAEAQKKRFTIDRPVPPRADNARLLAGSERLGNERVIVVVGSSLDEHLRAQDQLALTLAIALPALTVIVICAGWFIVGAALRPMRSMVSEADALSVARRGRLSVQGPTELAELASHLNDMLARIEAALDHERAFLDNASHELRTPIAIARGELELARPLASDSPAVGAALDSALEEVDRLQTLAVNLLDLARTRAAGPPPATKVDLHAVCAQAIDSIHRAGHLDGVAVSLRGEAFTVGDATALARAVTNLVDNAVRHAGHDVTVTVGRPNGASVVQVRDDGPGFPPDVVDHSGERFIPGAHGVGLGLAIVEAIAGAHGGRLELSNAGDDPPGAIARLELA
jgi:two-component system, OmpR family, sensor kinase